MLVNYQKSIMRLNDAEKYRYDAYRLKNYEFLIKKLESVIVEDSPITICEVQNIINCRALRYAKIGL